MMTDDADQEQGALFELEGPDEDECVWLVSGGGHQAITINLGPRPAVAEKLDQWLEAIDFGEQP
ncbi:hypothetical protein [Sphingosinicella rhizophila]|uniref:Uncharacterized protein n=1 Tax=Sphingosinicella rhizophila TaxID=3050082 RepID=A0ABU3Q555_9SPHN|nr:hypothetical protein [Sphingosinicella sp. GR2756]MDT9598550.1 hypothetical protein [Sphingosinicella sp. GR2756]